MTLPKRTKKSSSECQFAIEPTPQGLRLALKGILTAQTAAPIWTALLDGLYRQKPKTIDIDAAGIADADSAGLAVLAYLMDYGKKNDIAISISALAEPFSKLLERLASVSIAQPAQQPKPVGYFRQIAELTVALADDLAQQIAFLGHFFCAVGAIFYHRRWRWRDFFELCRRVGADAAGIVLLLGFLFGLIMAFSSAMPLRQFGVEIYVADLVALALARVLGPFLTAVIVAGRTGSAFAAELGTMKINNELDALTVMNLDPVRFLVVPRAAAAMLMTPLLTALANLAGLVGCGAVILSIGYTLSIYLNHIENILDPTDLAVGLVKSLVFGAAIGLIGALRGLQTKAGASAVGIAATRAVVSAIVWLVILEGVFSVLLYVLDI